MSNQPNEALIFKDLENIWSQIKTVYETDFRALVYGEEFPTAEEILQTFQKIKQRLSEIKWTVSIDEASK